MTHARRWIAAAAAAVVGIGLTGCGAAKSSPEPGDDVLVNKSSYGFATSKDVGTVFTAGMTVSEVAQGPIVIEDVDPVLDGDVLAVDGTGVRVLFPQQGGKGFQEMPAWPPKAANRDDWKHFGGLTGEGSYEVPGPKDGKRESLHVLIGYKVKKEGRGAQRGIWVTYNIGGKARKAFLGSYVAVCAPAGTACSEEGPEGEKKG